MRRLRRRKGARYPTPTLAVAGMALAALLAVPLPAQGENWPLPNDAAAETGEKFTLVDQDGLTVTDVQFRGKWLLVYFGYTHCPDTCPTTLSTMAEALDQLGPATRRKVQAIFITVDPERDTPAVMKDYVGAFEGADILGLTGTPKQVSVAGEAYQVRARRFGPLDGDYTMSHSSKIHVIDPGGHLVAATYPEHLAGHLARLLP